MVARFDEDDFGDQDLAVLAGRDRSIVLPKAARRLPPDSIDVLTEMQGLTLEVVRLENRLRALTDEGRELGISWSLLGWVQGLTGEAVRRRQVEA